MAKKSYKFLKNKIKNKFLNLYVLFGSISKAAEKADIARQTHYDWLRDDAEYQVAFNRAQDMVGDMLEDEAKRRAIGYEEDVFFQGKKVGTRKVYSDRLLEFLLKGAKPDKYKDRVQQETVDMGPGAMNWEDYEDDGEEAEDNYSVPSDENLGADDTSEP